MQLKSKMIATAAALVIGGGAYGMVVLTGAADAAPAPSHHGREVPSSPALPTDDSSTAPTLGKLGATVDGPPPAGVTVVPGVRSDKAPTLGKLGATVDGPPPAGVTVAPAAEAVPGT